MPDKIISLDDIFFIDSVNLPTSKAKVKIKATHAGYINKNYVMYTDELLQNSYKSFIKPYIKPIVINHSSDQNDVIGRIVNARIVKTGLQNGPSSFIELDGYINGYSNAERVKDNTLLTVSIRAIPTKKTKVTCSICNKDISDELFDHEHQKGETYGKKTCYYIIDGEVEYAHVAFVPEPADIYASAMAVEDSFHCVVSNVDLNNEEIEEMEKTLTNAEDKNENETQKQINDSDATTISNENTNDTKNENKSTDDIQTNTENNSKDNVENKEMIDQKENDISTKCNDCEDFSSITEDELKELQTLDLMLEKEIGEDRKLSTKKRNELPDTSFCGPNRTFPVPDCAHVTAALRLLGRAKVSESTKNKIKACVNRKAKSLGCAIQKDDYEKIIDYLNDKFMPEIKEYINNEFNKIREDLSDKSMQSKYDALKVETNKLGEKLQESMAELHSNRLLALRAIKMLLSADSNINMNDIAISQDEIVNFEESIKTLVDDDEDVNKSNKQVENNETETNLDENKNTLTIDNLNELPTNKKIEILNNLFNK